MSSPPNGPASRPLLVVVSGRPGSGKSTLAQRLGDRSLLWLPVVSHDAPRSALRAPGSGPETRGAVPVERSIGLFYDTIVRFLEAGAGVIAELSWRRGISEGDLGRVARLSRAVNVHCDVPVEVAHRRFVQRERVLRPGVEPADGPAGHIVRQMERGEFPWDVFDPLDLDMPRIRVDTTEGYLPGLDTILAFCRTGRQPEATPRSSPSDASQVVIRPARMSDIDALRGMFLELHREHAEALPDVLRLPDLPGPEIEDFSTAIVNELCYFAVAEQDGEVVGFVDASHHMPGDPSDADRPWCRINNLVVRGDRRRRGIATALIRAAENWGRGRGYPDVRLDVFEFNTAARKLYERLGYAPLSLQMRKRLIPGP